MAREPFASPTTTQSKHRLRGAAVFVIYGTAPYRVAPDTGAVFLFSFSCHHFSGDDLSRLASCRVSFLFLLSQENRLCFLFRRDSTVVLASRKPRLISPWSVSSTLLSLHHRSPQRPASRHVSPTEVRVSSLDGWISLSLR